VLSGAKVRRASARDKSTLLGLWLDLVEHHRRLDPAYPTVPGLREVLLGELARGLESASCRIWIAELDDAPAGFLFAELEAGRPPETAAAWIHELFVLAGRRRRGVASRLVEAADAWLVEAGTRTVRVRVEAGNGGGLAFWSARGFDEKSRVLERETAQRLLDSAPP
jgi:GNAT superfamily N-acetyltransferase